MYGFLIFSKKKAIIDILRKKHKNHIKSESIKIQESNLVIILIIFPQKWQFRLKDENFEISRYSAK